MTFKVNDDVYIEVHGNMESKDGEQPIENVYFCDKCIDQCIAVPFEVLMDSMIVYLETRAGPRL